MNPFNWFKVYHGITNELKWRLVARNIGLPEGTILSVWIAILEYASQQEERGSVRNFPCEDYDCCFGYEDGTCEKVFSALSQRGLIIDNFVANWGKRQSMQDIKTPPKTDAQRQAECRERKKQAAQEQNADVTKCHDDCDTVTKCHDDCDTVTKCHNVTPIREEENREDKNRVEEIREEKTISSNLAVGQARPVKSSILRQDDFEQWYLAYPRHEGKQGAIKAWNKAIKENALPETNILLASLEWQKNLAQWQDKQFIPLPASYLNGRRWQDEKPAPYVAPTFQQGQKAPVYDPNRTWTGEEMLAYYTNLEREFNEEMAQKNAQKEQAASAAIGE